MMLSLVSLYPHESYSIHSVDFVYGTKKMPLFTKCTPVNKGVSMEVKATPPRRVDGPPKDTVLKKNVA